MKNFRIGDWIIGPPVNQPVKLLELTVDNQGIKTMDTDGDIFKSNLNEKDRLCTPEEVALALSASFIEKHQPEHIHCHCYDEETDTLNVNCITVYRDGKFIEAL